MKITITPISQIIGARITGAKINKPMDKTEFSIIREAFDRHLILVFPGQPMTDDQQIAFSRQFGFLEKTPSKTINPGAGTPFARQSNIEIKTGDFIPPEDRRMFYQKANMLWHSDSSFKPIPSLCSVLTARVVPLMGGATEFASTRAAYNSLSKKLKASIENLTIEYDFAHSRGLVGFTFAENELSKMTPVRHRLVRTNAANGEKSVMIGAHAKCVVGWPEDESRALLDDLLARATRPENTYRHEWKEGDAIVWDNQGALHRATEYDTKNHKRLMQRTTVSSGTPSSVMD